MADVTTLHEQVEQMATLRVENQRLAEQLRGASQSSRTDTSELLRLRAQATKLRQVEQENLQLKADRDRLAQSTRPPPQSKLDEDPFDRDFGPGTRTKVSNAKYWGFALRNYAAGNQDRFPANLGDATPYLHEELTADEKAQALEALSRYELLFHGSLDQLNSLPNESTIILREKEPWLDAQGRWCKTYCFADGSSSVRVMGKNDFAQWEGLRIPKSKQQ